MKNKIKASLLLLAITPFLASCDRGPKETGGALLGGVGGALLGAQFGGGTGQLAATAAGALLGAWAGSSFGQSLDQQDKREAEHALQASLNSGEQTTWSGHRSRGRHHSDRPAYGTYTPEAPYTENHRVCRNVKQAIYLDGKVEEATVKACQNAAGNWELVNRY